jgi:hypothetical protein
MLRLVAVVTLTAALVAALAGNLELAAYLLPLCLLVGPLAVGRYVGEETLDRLRRRRGTESRVPARMAPAGRRAATLVARGGRLIAEGMAERGPPAVALT